MDHFLFCPEALEKIIGILRKTCGIRLPEIAAPGMVGSWFPDIIDSAPDKLPHAERSVQIPDNAGAQVLCAPAGIAVPESGALQIRFTQNALIQREMVYPPAEKHA